LDGFVKVTVIATGFDRTEARPPAPASSHTPVDLQHYTAHLKERQDIPAAAPAMAMGRLSIARRASLDLAPAATAPAAMAAAEGSSALDAGEMDLESLSAFDVPAFLRREG
ncbi:MAG: hypothetical protein ABIS29_09195, partial [Vicinamibacterales bacterium]